MKQLVLREHGSWKIAFLLIFSLSVFSNATAQIKPQEKDTVIIEKEDTLVMVSYAKRYDPRKALLYAAIVPGLGQAYNKKYWKMPLVYGGALAIGWQIQSFNNTYQEFRGYLFYNLQHDLAGDTDINPQTGRQTQNIRRVVDHSRRNRDFWVILMGGLYILQIIDAHVDAHLKEFDLNPNLKVSFQPMIESDQVLGRQKGLSMTLKF
jgi:hypothetical protein